MDSKLTKIFCYLSTAAAGFAGLFLQSRLLTLGYDQKGLLMTSRLELVLLWALTGLVAVTVLFFLPRLGARGTYEMNFPRCVTSGVLILTAGVLMGFSGFNGLVPGRLPIIPGLTFAAAVLLVLVGVCRMTGRKPGYWLELLICLFFCANLLLSYRSWNARPNVQQFAFQLLTQVWVMIFTLHRARCAGGMMDRRRLVFSGFLGLYCSFVALAGAGDPAFFGAAGLYCAGGMCELARFSRRRRMPAVPLEEQPSPEPEEGV